MGQSNKRMEKSKRGWSRQLISFSFSPSNLEGYELTEMEKCEEREDTK